MCYFRYSRLLLRGFASRSYCKCFRFKRRDNCKQQCFYIRDEIKEKRPRCLVEYTDILVRVYLVNVYFSSTQVALSFSYGVLIVFYILLGLFSKGLPWHSKT